MTSPPLCIANLIVNETWSRVTVPPTRQGPCSDSAGPGPTPDAISKTSWLWSAGPRNRSETPKENLDKRWPRSTSTTAARTKFCGFQHSPWEYGTDQRRPGVPTRSHCREFLRERQKSASPSKNFPLHWCGSLARESSARRPMPHTGSRGLASANRLLPVLKR